MCEHHAIPGDSYSIKDVMVNIYYVELCLGLPSILLFNTMNEPTLKNLDVPFLSNALQVSGS